jgi:hypothetical protein
MFLWFTFSTVRSLIAKSPDAFANEINFPAKKNTCYKYHDYNREEIGRY